VERRSYIQLAIFLLLAAMGWGCKNSIEVNQDESGKDALVGVQLESDFRDDSIEVEFDSRSMFVGRLSTNYSLALAWSSRLLAVPAGIHTVRVSVPVDSAAGYLFAYMHDTTIVTVNYDRQARHLEFQTYDHSIPRR
jgi:hypothetical protein